MDLNIHGVSYRYTISICFISVDIKGGAWRGISVIKVVLVMAVSHCPEIVWHLVMNRNFDSFVSGETLVLISFRESDSVGKCPRITENRNRRKTDHQKVSK